MFGFSLVCDNVYYINIHTKSTFLSTAQDPIKTASHRKPEFPFIREIMRHFPIYFFVSICLRVFILRVPWLSLNPFSVLLALSSFL